MRYKILQHNKKKKSGDMDIYGEKRDAVKYVIRESHGVPWNSVISDTEDDKHSRQMVCLLYTSRCV